MRRLLGQFMPVLGLLGGLVIGVVALAALFALYLLALRLLEPSLPYRIIPRTLSSYPSNWGQTCQGQLSISTVDSQTVYVTCTSNIPTQQGELPGWPPPAPPTSATTGEAP